MSQIITRLYVKTHNVTGLKYFGKTTKTNWQSYKGSGTYWKRHIKIHGYDVTTEILGIFDDAVWLSLYAHEFSYQNDIVNSNLWANLIPESGFVGRWYGNDNEEDISIRKLNAHLHGKRMFDEKIGIHGLSVAERSEMRIRSAKTQIKNKTSNFVKINYDPVNKAKVKATHKLNKHQQGETNSQFGTYWIFHEIAGKIKIPISSFDDYYSQGWHRGMKDIRDRTWRM